MEEQPIDNLFKRKLQDAEIKPRAAAWAALKAKRSPRRIVPVWTYMAVAASLLIVGAFGWWALQSRDGVIAPHTSALQVATGPTATIASSRNDAQITKTDRLTSPTISEQVQSVKAPNSISLHQQGIAQIKAKTHTTPKREANPEMEVTIQPVIAVANKTESSRFEPKPVVESTLEVTVTKEIHKDIIIPAPERTLIVSIDIPAKAVPIPTASTVTDDSASHNTGFGGLLKKVKQIKDGDVFALSANTTTKTNRRGFGKFYNDVKESIKNNSAD